MQRDVSARVELPGTQRAAPAAQPAGPPDPTARMQVTVYVRPCTDPQPHAAQLATQPPGERTYLSRAAFAQTYGAAPDDVAAVERFALESGLLVIAADLARRSIVVEGTVAQMAAAFEADVSLYRRDGVTFRARTGALTIPASLEAVVTGIFGIDERPQARAHFRRRTHVRPAASGAMPFTPPHVATLYDYPPGTDGSGQTIALIELGGGYADADLSTYFGNLGIPVPAVTSVSVDGATNAPSGDPSSADGEVALDIQVAGTIAPGCRFVVYFAPNTDAGFLDAITTAIHDTTHAPTVISISWGGPESSWTAQATANFDTAFADAATLGITVCVAVGDNGSSDGVNDGLAHVDFPASSPHVLACGGTTLTANGTAIASETVWNDGANGGATGGGISDVFGLPTWQQGAGVPPSANPGARVGRGVPDVAGDADPMTGYQTLVDGQSGVVGGTSAVAPLWAALIARINQGASKPAGFVNALLYARAASVARDITRGSNGAYNARAGWDPCTGIGSPNGIGVAAALAATASPAG